ncbi:MAG: branched-chain amino acid ABC transporter permease, partial [Candidatus Heimdallarchaeota archaeon]
MNINWSYYWDEIKGRGSYIFGFLGLVFITSMGEWVIIGPFITKSQELGILPNNVGLALFLTKAAVLAIFAVSWDLLSGYSGQISFGHALFLGMGAYISSLVKLGLTLKGFTIFGKEFTSLKVFPGYKDDIQEIGGILIDLSVLKAIVVASIVIGGFALVLGILTLRLKGAYFALVTLVIPLIAQVLVTKIWDDYTGGDGGISLFGRASLVKQTEDENLNFLEKYQRQIEDQYLVILVLMIISIFLMYMLARSRYGLILK